MIVDLKFLIVITKENQLVYNVFKTFFYVIFIKFLENNKCYRVIKNCEI